MDCDGFSVSIVIRAFDEERYIGHCINAINNQKCSVPFEVLVVDSGSFDRTVDISKGLGARVIHLRKEDFTFGYALNKGIDNANNKIIVVIVCNGLNIKIYFIHI